MKELAKIEGRTTTIVTNSFAPFGETAGASTPAEDSSKWHSQQFTYSDVLKRYGLTDATYDGWRANGFPAPDKSGRGPASLRWRAEKVFEWESRVRAMAARLPKR